MLGGIIRAVVGLIPAPFSTKNAGLSIFDSVMGHLSDWFTK